MVSEENMSTTDTILGVVIVVIGAVILVYILVKLIAKLFDRSK